MKKVSIVLLLVVTMMLSMVGCNTSTQTPTTDIASVADESTQAPKQNISPQDIVSMLEPQGQYNQPGFGSEFYIYRFDGTDVVIYKIMNNIYLLCDDSGEQGTSYANLSCLGHFLGFSDKYMLFLTDEGKTAVSFEEQEKEEDGSVILFNPHIPYEDLTEEEQQSFLYPISYEKVIRDEEPAT